MLTSALLGAGTGLVKFGMDKVARSMEEEAKVKAEAEREARIEEAAIRTESRKNERSDFEYDRKAADETITKAEERQAKADEEVRKQRMLNDPYTLQGQKTVAEIETTQSQGMLANANTLEKERKGKQDELILDMQRQLVNETDPTKRSEIATKIGQMSGKTGDENKTLSKVVTPDGKSFFEITGVLNTRTGQEKWAENTTPINPREVEAKAIAYANLQAGTNLKNVGEADALKSKGWGDTQDNNAKKAQSFTNAYNEFKVNGGKIVEQDKSQIGKVEAGKVSNVDSLIKTNNPVEQKQLDSLFNVIKAGESGNKGVAAGTPKPTADNPNPTASGTFQIIDENLKSHGIKPELPNGKYSPAQKDAFAPTFYKEVYDKTGGNQAAIVAAGFGQEDVYQAIEKAKANGSNNWWDYLNQNGGVEKNMSVIKSRIKQQQQYLIKNDIPVPVSISDFRLNNK